MRAATYTRYGPPQVVCLNDVPLPEPKPGEILVRVRAAGVTTGDWRLRAAAFPGILAVPGRAMFGILAPRRAVLGSDFAGEVAGLGEGAQGFTQGQRVYGASLFGAHAEYLTIRADGAVAPAPPGLNDVEAAALPFGALSALGFLRDHAKVQAGHRVLVVGASGGVGCYAIQIARAMGAEVAGVASAANADLIASLGAEAIDYRAGDYLSGGRIWDVILDTVGAVSFAQARRALSPDGVFVPLNYGVPDIVASVRSKRPRIALAVTGESRADLDRLSAMVADGSLRPVIDRVLPFEEIRGAYAHVEGRHRRGAVILRIAPEPAA